MMSDLSAASFALSPARPLSSEQQSLSRQIEQFVRERLRQGEPGVFVVEGEAGTGKSVLIHHLFSRLRYAARYLPGDPLQGSSQVLLVNHAEMIKAYHHAAEHQPDLRKKDYLRPTTFINLMHAANERVDVALVDEAHLLLTRSDKYNRFQQENQLAEILKLAKIVVLVFDPGQVLKFKSLWRDGDLDALLAGRHCERRVLRRQWRMHASPAVLDWVAAVRQGRLLPLPASSDDFELRIFDDAAAMYARIRERDAECGRSRMLASYDFPYRLDGRDHFVKTGTLKLRWDRAMPAAQRPWAERADTIDEIGSVYTVQGFDLNYVGLILGPSFGWDAQAGMLSVDPSRHEDDGAFQGKGRISGVYAVQQRLMLNAISVLMTRAMRGLYLYAHDDELRRQLFSPQTGDSA